MQSSHTLTATRRERLGSRYAKREREQGRLPGVLYGHGQEPVPISLDARETLRFLRLGEKVFSIDLEGAQRETVLLKEIQYGYLGDNVIHIDLARVDLNEQIETNVPLRLVGDAVGLKKAGAILTHPSVTIEVRCTVATIPDHIEVNIAHLDVGGVVHAGEIALPEGVELVSDDNAIVAAISVAKEEEAPATGEAAAVEGEAAEPEVLTAKKKEEEEQKE